MTFAIVNWWAILVSAVVVMFLGALWYGPIFGKVWMQLFGFTEKDKKKAKQQGMARSYIINLIATLVMVFVLAILLVSMGPGIRTGLTTAVAVWLGFIVTTMLGSVLWENKSFKLYLINIFYYLISLLIAGAILSAWV